MKWLCMLCVLLVLGLAGCTMVVQPVTPQPTEEMSEEEMGEMGDEDVASEDMGSEAMSADDKIANALMGGPAAVAENAAVVDWPSDASGTLPELRAGSNGWTCLPDDPTSPTNDPYCLDNTWLEFFAAFVGGREPVYPDIGIGYMLQGGSGASSTDPTILEPAEGEDWMIDGPHFMVVSPTDLDPADFSVDPMLGVPYIMFEGTPYEHLMVPVETVEAQPADDKIANAMSAAPAAISAEAAIMDFPAEMGGDLVELRAGSNGWTCLPDSPTTPADDPMCVDAAWLKWIEAYVTGTEPEKTSVGIAYMLQGESAASNTDPFLAEPAAGEDWMVDGPHVMVLSPEPLDPEIFSTEHRMDGTYIMWAGTPYEHLMVPATLPEAE